MPQAMVWSTGVAAYLALFVGIAIAFLGVTLLVGKLVRPRVPEGQKAEIYECGEPSIGSSYVQFDLRFYVVALLFIIFDVEVAVFYPWAAVFGKAQHLARVSHEGLVHRDDDGKLAVGPTAQGLYREMGVASPSVPAHVPPALEEQVTAASEWERADQIIRQGARQLAWLTTVDILLFFAILLVGFAYVWRRGDLDWVRVAREAPVAASAVEPVSEKPEPQLTA